MEGKASKAPEPETAGRDTTWTAIEKIGDRPVQNQNLRKPPETAGHDLNWTNMKWIWGRPVQNQNRQKPPETAGNRRVSARQVLASVPVVGAQLPRELMFCYVAAAIHSRMAFQKLARIQSVGT